MSATAMDQKTYLKKYLGGPSRKKKKKLVKGQGIKIIDDDLDLSKLRPLDNDELDLLGEGEDAPVVAGIIDERSEEVKKMEQFNTSSKWRVVTQDDGFNSKLQIEEIKKGIKEAEKENEIIFGKMYSDSEDEQNKNSDASPPKQQSKTEENCKVKKPQNNSDSDFSPPRKNNREPSHKRQTDKNRDSDVSPSRKNDSHKSKDRVRKASRWGNVEEYPNSKSEISNSESRDRFPGHRSKTEEKTRLREKSPDSDASPPRKSKSKHIHADKGSSRNEEKFSKNAHKSRHNSASDSDISPPRKKPSKRSKSIDFDASPPRKPKSAGRRHAKKDTKRAETSGKNSDSDLSPPRRISRRSKSPNERSKRRRNSDSDISPPRRDRSGTSRGANRFQNRNSPPPSNKKLAKTLEGKLAGLQDARQLREENEAFRRREDEAFTKLGDHISGRNAQAVSRKGKRETSEDRQKLREKAERQKELDEKYKKWSKGLKQVEAQEARVAEYMHEAAKPVARHRDDADLESSLRHVERAGDPMLQYIRERQRERGDLPPAKPTYKGNFPPNRFNIRPGYRWDGVDRSNGYERKYFEQHAKRKAQEEEAYKWSTEDL